MIGRERLHDACFSCSMAVEGKYKHKIKIRLKSPGRRQDKKGDKDRAYSLSLAGGSSPASLFSSAWTCRSWSPQRYQACRSSLRWGGLRGQAKRSQQESFCTENPRMLVTPFKKCGGSENRGKGVALKNK